MDYIEVIDQKIYAYHGVLPEEKKEGQYFYISFKAYLDTSEAAAQDEMALSVSYADMCRTVKETVTGHVFDLIETVADRCAKALLLEYNLLQRVELTVKKPSAPVGEPVAYPAVTVERGWHTAFISVGSNMGDSRETIVKAVDCLGKDSMNRLVAQAQVLETQPWGKEDQPNFFNTALELRTLYNPRQLMGLLLALEKDFHRERIVKWGPRTLDLDLIFYDDLVTEDPFVTLPHPLMEDRAFVLEPLCELAPNLIHPVLKKRLFRLLEDLKQKG